MSEPQNIDTVVIGAGQAGLAMSYWLRQREIDHVVLERQRVGETWASQRWDSFFLNTINAINTLPGDHYDGSSPVGFPSRDEFVAYLRAYRERHELPVREHTEVTRLRATDTGFELAAGADRITCRNVVVCSGDQNAPALPEIAASLPTDIAHMHAGAYRSAAMLPAGAVLVVGSGQSGVQVVEDLLQAGREVYLSTSCVGRAPRRYRGRDVLEWMRDLGLGDQRPEDVPDPSELSARQPQVSGTDGGHSVSLHQLARAGVQLLGRLERIDGRTLHFAGDLLANVARGDEQVPKIRAGIDMFIDKTGRTAPPPEPDPVDQPFTGLDAMAARRTIDLDATNIGSVIFCTGFSGRFDYVDAQLLDERGRPRHRHGECETPGLYCLGFMWLRRRFSGLVAGVDGDAAHIAGLIAARNAAAS